MRKILVVEDDLDLLGLMKLKFKDDTGTEFVFASSYSQGMSLISQGQFDLFLIDINLDTFSGLDIMRILRKGQNIDNRVIVMSADDNPEQQIQAYELGASNYLVKPLNFHLLSSIIRKNLRSLDAMALSEIDTSHFLLDINSCSCYVKNDGETVQVHLTRTEFNILMRLSKSPNVVISKDELSFLGKDENEAMTYKSLEMHISSLRRKLNCNTIQTKRGLGYLLTG